MRLTLLGSTDSRLLGEPITVGLGVAGARHDCHMQARSVFSYFLLLSFLFYRPVL